MATDVKRGARSGERRGARSVERGAGESVGELEGRGVVALTKTQMAAALQVSVRTLNGMMARGEIAYFKIGSRIVRFRIEEAFKRMDETVLVPEE